MLLFPPCAKCSPDPLDIPLPTCVTWYTLNQRPKAVVIHLFGHVGTISRKVI